jgi:hypothetical protein
MDAPAGCPPTKKITHAHTYIHWERYGHLRTRKTIEITTHTHRHKRKEETLTEHQVIPPQRDTNTNIHV